jgi:hypothetical protein
VTTPLNDVSCARIPADLLGALAPLRAEPDLEVATADRDIWLRWRSADDRVLRAVLPLPSCVLFTFHAGRWHRFGQALPDFSVPTGLDYRRLSQVLFPAPVSPLPAPERAMTPARLTIRPDSRPRPTTALRCRLADFAAWADGLSSYRLARYRAAREREELLVLGPHLPALPAATRFWGNAVLVPLGFCPEPDLPESTLLQAAGLDDALLLLGRETAEIIPKQALSRVTRASLRLAVREGRA